MCSFASNTPHAPQMWCSYNFEVEGGVASRLGLQHLLHSDACITYIRED